jgi:hypothetical protein
LNAIAYGATNVRFMQGNSLTDEVKKIVEDYDILFSDPARKESEEERRLETLLPSPLKVLKFYSSHENFIFDLPPQISLRKIPSDWEKEFISLNGRITRFTSYFGDLRQHDRVAVALPSGAKFWSDEPLEDYNCRAEIKSTLLMDYIYIVDESLYYARLLKEFSEHTGIDYLQIGRRRTLATGNVTSSFLQPFKVLCKGSLEDIIKCFKEEGVSKVTLRFSMNPKEYWRMRSRIEKELKGDLKGSIFRIGDTWVGTRNVT